MAAGGTGSPCGACKFLRRKCAPGCVFAPYFCSEQGPARFAAIHKVFGASNVSKLLSHVPESDRCEAVVTIAYEAQARMHNPVHGCVAQIFALQQQVACLQAQLVQARAQLARGIIGCRSSDNPLIPVTFPTRAHSGCAPSSIDNAVGYDKCATGMHEIDVRHDEFCFQPSCSAKKRPIHGDLGELQALAHRMMGN